MPAMPGMGGGRPTGSHLVSAFHAALLHQGLAVAALLLLVAATWRALRSVQLRHATAAAGSDGTGRAPEPPARHLLRIGFGLLWLFDGVLQGQASMPGGMVPDVLRPAADGSPAWVHRLVHLGISLWSAHPVTAAAAAVWIQVGLGLWLLAAPRGRWSRAAGAAGAGWGIGVWVFGEAFGGLFGPGASWLFGTPGAALLYAVAGVLLALPEPVWGDRRLVRAATVAAGSALLGLALLQAWPGRGFWAGRHPGGALGPVAAMVTAMAHTPQPPVLAGWLSGFASFAARHGVVVNLLATGGPAVVGALLLAGRRRSLGAAVAVGAVLAAAGWVLIQDLGFQGGVGTDPNSMVPGLLLLGGVALARLRPAVGAPATDTDATPAVDPTGTPVRPVAAGRNRRHRWIAGLTADPTFTFRVVATMAAVAVVLIGATPMAVAAVAGPR